MNTKIASVVLVGSLVALALAAAPPSERQAIVLDAQPTPHSADHERIQGEAGELPPQF